MTFGSEKSPASPDRLAIFPFVGAELTLVNLARGPEGQDINDIRASRDLVVGAVLAAEIPKLVIGPARARSQDDDRGAGRRLRERVVS